MADVNASALAEQIGVNAVVIRCMCGAPDSHQGQVCPQGVEVDLGTVAFYHKSPLVRLKYKLARLLHGPLTFWHKPKEHTDGTD